MTEPDEVVERLTAQLNHLVSLESVGVMVKTADLAAVLVRAARIKELEARVAELERRLSGGAGGYPPSGAYFENGKAMFGGRGGGGQG